MKRDLGLRDRSDSPLPGRRPGTWFERAQQVTSHQDRYLHDTPLPAAREEPDEGHTRQGTLKVIIVQLLGQRLSRTKSSEGDRRLRGRGHHWTHNRLHRDPAQTDQI
jgi:hypothetical protein